MFINHTNHLSENWSDVQLREAGKYGTIVDIPFPDIDPELDGREVAQLANQKAEEIIAMKPDAVLCQGEFTYTFCLVQILKARGIRVMAACSRRVTQEYTDENRNTRRVSVFEFVRFREY
ncbi:MAG: hypothetical protein LUF35_07265 [Lachnospiraceae bacterium]|nr:hypothetical protein [Lachnospiraceae bacterium]